MSDKTLSFDKLVENVESVHAVTSLNRMGRIGQNMELAFLRILQTV